MNILEQQQAYRLGGRSTWQEGILYLAYSASFIEFCVSADSNITASLISQAYPEGDDFTAWAAVFINGQQEPCQRFCLQHGLHSYELYKAPQEANSQETVTIRLMKYSEAAFSSMGIKGIELERGVLRTPPAEQERLIQFIGDSITCGYGIEGTVEVDTFNTRQENPWNAYACLTARAMEADFELVSWSGNGIISHFVEETVNVPRHEEALMPELYPYSDRRLEERLGKQEAELTLWKSKREPDVIVVNLGTNDGSYTRYIPERSQCFTEAYVKFLGEIRKEHPKAPIIAMLGVMRQELNEQAALAVATARQQGDENVYFIELPLARDWDGLGTDYHPSPRTHEKMAELLTCYIRYITQ